MLPFRGFLSGLRDLLVEAVAEAENAGWHHLDANEPLHQHYLRLCTWTSEVHERLVRFDYIKARTAGNRWEPRPTLPAPRVAVAGHVPRLHVGELRPDQQQLAGGDGDSGRAGDDSC